MFVGVSKNIGGGFRIGIGTKIGSGNKKPSNKELQTQKFISFLKQVEDDLNNALFIFIEANGEDYYQLLKDEIDLDEIFKDNEKYHIFIKIYNDAKYEIEKILYSGDSGIVAKRAITEAVFSVKKFINSEYPNFKPKIKPEWIFHKIVTFILKGILLVFLFFLVFGIVGVMSQKDKQTKDTIKKEIVIEYNTN